MWGPEISKSRKTVLAPLLERLNLAVDALGGRRARASARTSSRTRRGSSRLDPDPAGPFATPLASPSRRLRVLAPASIRASSGRPRRSPHCCPRNSRACATEPTLLGGDERPFSAKQDGHQPHARGRGDGRELLRHRHGGARLLPHLPSGTSRARVAPAATAIEQGMAVARREARGAKKGVRSGPAPGEVEEEERRGASSRVSLGRFRPDATRACRVGSRTRARIRSLLIRSLEIPRSGREGRKKINTFF